MVKPIEPICDRSVELQDRELLRRRRENRKYLMELENDKLLLHHRFEAGLDTHGRNPEDFHGGWESPLCQLRGHFLGHWLSAAAMEVSATGDRELKAKADTLVGELAKCQDNNGGEWCASIPEKYLTLIARGKGCWAPQYTIHKTFMGLLDMYELTGNEEALAIARSFAQWFIRWSSQFNEEEFNRILDVETGGMLEVWSQLYGITKEPAHRGLMDKYYRKSLFDGLLEGRDVLTNMHANTTIPEALGAARAYEVTGEAKWLAVVKAYWDEAVTKRGFYCTGGQTAGEIWTPKMSLSPRLGEKNQEHCTVYNMMRLADFLFRHTGEAVYGDYWERNLYNGIMAQAYYQFDRGGHGETSPYPETGLLTYFLPLKSGGVKAWSSKTKHFYCCHGSLVQANAGHVRGIFYKDDAHVYVNQYTPSDVSFEMRGTEVRLLQRTDTLAGNDHITGSMTGSQTIKEPSRQPNHPELLKNYLYIYAQSEVPFTLKIRLPWWHKGEAVLFINGEKTEPQVVDNYITITRSWKEDTVCFQFNKTIQACPLPDAPDTVAFMYGPVVLAGLSRGQALEVKEGTCAEQLLVHDNEREWSVWRDTFRTVNQSCDIPFIPLYKVGYEPYSVYFPLKKA